MMVIMCDKCGKHMARHVVSDCGRIIHLCDECAGTEPVKSVTHTNATGEWKEYKTKGK